MGWVSLDTNNNTLDQSPAFLAWGELIKETRPANYSNVVFKTLILCAFYRFN